jgi:hypothetical protein
MTTMEVKMIINDKSDVKQILSCFLEICNPLRLNLRQNNVLIPGNL